MVAKQTVELFKKGRFETKLRAGRYYIPVRIEIENGRILFFFSYNKELIEEIKVSFEGRKYHGFIEGDGRKIWSVPITMRNLFQFEALQGKYGPNPYSRWSNLVDLTEEVAEFCKHRTVPVKPYRHQLEMVSQALQVKWFLMAAEMGTGKTLAAILTVEMCPYDDVIWVGPRSALVAAKGEFLKWRPDFNPMMFTYDGLRKLVENWPSGKPAPRVLILDESSKCKTPTAKRSVAAKYVADSMRKEYGEECYILELSGTPAPKKPIDWWMQCEIACPGFIRESNIFHFQRRLAYIERKEEIPGAGSFDYIKGWKDNESKCQYCGEPEDHANHDVKMSVIQDQTFETHKFVPGVNEVVNLKKRLNGLVGTWLKRDCLDLPEKRYEVIELEPSEATLNAARMIVNNTSRAADALIRLRTLSDGFLYRVEGTGEYKQCDGCKGTGKVKEYFDKDNPHDIVLDEEVSGGYRYEYDYSEDPPKIVGKKPAVFDSRSVDCYLCGGSGEIEIEHRTITEVDCPKVDLLKQLLEEHEEIGRFNVYAGFEGSIIRCVKVAHQEGWTTIKADGRGWAMHDPQGCSIEIRSEEMIHEFQNGDTPKICFIGQPGAAGMGLTLTASPTTFFYSNDFNPESRQQAEDRGHRIGMDVIRGGRIIDCIHLPSDRKVLESLKKSKQLQLMSMQGLKNLFQENKDD